MDSSCTELCKCSTTVAVLPFVDVAHLVITWVTVITSQPVSQSYLSWMSLSYTIANTALCPLWLKKPSGDSRVARHLHHLWHKNIAATAAQQNAQGLSWKSMKKNTSGENEAARPPGLPLSNSSAARLAGSKNAPADMEVIPRLFLTPPRLQDRKIPAASGQLRRRGLPDYSLLLFLHSPKKSNQKNAWLNPEAFVERGKGCSRPLKWAAA